MGKYIDPFTDRGFKLLFGSENRSEEFLISFLNELFKGETDFENIEKIKYGNTERSSDELTPRLIRFDIYCTTSTGHKFIVEMQNQSQDFFMSRAVYYISRTITQQGKRDQSGKPWDYSFMPVVGVFMCNFNVPGLKKKLITHVGLMDTKTHEIISDKEHYTFIQLPEFKKTEGECITDFDKWIYLLKNMNKMERMPFIKSPNDIFSRFEKVSKVSSLNERERELYEADLKFTRDFTAQLKFANKQGRDERNWEIARNLKKMGVDIQTISSATGLNINDLNLNL